MPVDVLLENDSIVAQLRSAIHDGAHSLSDVPPLLKAVLRDERWKLRRIKTGQEVPFERFEDFVRTLPLEGLGADMPLIRRICGDDPEAVDLLDQATSREHGGLRQPEEAKIDNIKLESPPPTGTSEQYALRRLRKSRPDLHARVIAREVSPHAAMIEAGYRIRTVSIPVDPEAAARRLARHFDGASLERLIGELERLRAAAEAGSLSANQ